MILTGRQRDNWLQLVLFFTLLGLAVNSLLSFQIKCLFDPDAISLNQQPQRNPEGKCEDVLQLFTRHRLRNRTSCEETSEHRRRLGQSQRALHKSLW